MLECPKTGSSPSRGDLRKSWTSSLGEKQSRVGAICGGPLARILPSSGPVGQMGLLFCLSPGPAARTVSVTIPNIENMSATVPRSPNNPILELLTERLLISQLSLVLGHSTPPRYSGCQYIVLRGSILACRWDVCVKNNKNGSEKSKNWLSSFLGEASSAPATRCSPSVARARMAGRSTRALAAASGCPAGP